MIRAASLKTYVWKKHLFLVHGYRNIILRPTDSVRIMKLVLLGGTGRVGSNVLKGALERGHEVLAIARHPENIKTKHDNLQVCYSSICLVHIIGSNTERPASAVYYN